MLGRLRRPMIEWRHETVRDVIRGVACSENDGRRWRFHKEQEQ